MPKMPECHFDIAEPKYTHAMAQDREVGIRLDLYRAIYAGDAEKAEDIANMMAMVDIDRDLIFAARTEVRRG